MASFISCDVSHGPYLKYKIEMPPVEGTCSDASQEFKMNSNILGERYVFLECMDAGADKSKVIIERKGDTVLINFIKTNSANQLYELTVDINTQPRYNWLTIGNNTIPIVPTGH